MTASLTPIQFRLMSSIKEYAVCWGWLLAARGLTRLGERLDGGHDALLTGSPSVTSPTPCHVNSIYLSETHSTYVATVHFILQLWSLIKDDMINCLSLVPGTVTVESRAKVRKLGHLGPNYKQM